MHDPQADDLNFHLNEESEECESATFVNVCPICSLKSIPVNGEHTCTVCKKAVHALQILFLIIVFWINARAELHKGDVLSILQYFEKSRLCVIRVAHNSPDK